MVERDTKITKTGVKKFHSILLDTLNHEDSYFDIEVASSVMNNIFWYVCLHGLNGFDGKQHLSRLKCHEKGGEVTVCKAYNPHDDLFTLHETPRFDNESVISFSGKTKVTFHCQVVGFGIRLTSNNRSSWHHYKYIRQGQ